MASQQGGLKFFDILKDKNGGYTEYTNTDCFLGEYVNKLEQQAKSSENSAYGEESSLEVPPTPAPKANLPRWKRRTPEQIEANKLAQKRYRERKKAKLQEASSKVNTLQQQTQDFNKLEGEVRNKEKENLNLEAQLLALEAELSQVRIELDQKTPQGKFASEKKLACFGPGNLDSKTQGIGAKWGKAKNKLDKLLDGPNMLPSEQGAVTLSPTVQMQLEKRCLAAVQQCMQMLTFGGPALDDLLRTLPGGSEDLLRDSSMSEYRDLVKFLHLSPQQIEQLQTLLSSVLDRLQRIYKSREELNRRTLSLLAATPASPQRAGNASEGAQAEDLRSVLRQLQENLAEEQKLESEHHYLIMRDILTNLQGAWFISRAYPKHCDTLAFMLAVRKIQNNE